MKKITKKFTFVGFTLIELLFVIAIISVIATAGMSIVKQRAQEAKIDKSVLQIQQLLQAGMAYYVDNGCWPIKGGTPTGCTVSQPSDFTMYMPVSSAVNPWNKLYYWGPQNKLFEVSVDASSEAIANRIAGMLPNAAVGARKNCTATSCVYAQTAVSTQHTVFPSMFVIYRGSLSYTGDDFVPDDAAPPNGYYTNNPKSTPSMKQCPSSYYSDISVTPLMYDIYNYNSGDSRHTPAFPLALKFVTTLVPSNSTPTFQYKISVSTKAVDCTPHQSTDFMCTANRFLQNITIRYTIYCLAQSS